MEKFDRAPVRHRASRIAATHAASFIKSIPVLSLVCIVALFSNTAEAADTTKPSAPSALTGTAVSGTQINLTWTASTDNVGVTGYHVERCAGTSCTSWAEIGTTATTTYSDVGLTTVTTYRYRVRANDAAGNLSSYATAITVKTLDDQAPTAPTGLTATVNSAIKVTLSWTAATDNVAVKGYRIERCTGASCSTYAQIGTTTTAVKYADATLAPTTTYQYRVRANDAAGNLSSYSTSVAATTSADTAKPTAPTGVTTTVISSSQINVSWTASTDAVGVTGYRIERCTGATCTNYAEIATSTATTYTTYSNTGLTAGTSYRYRVRANDAAGNLSSYSSVVTAATQAADTQAPTMPGSLTATATSSTQIAVSWSASTDNVSVTAYLLERCQGSGCSSFAQIATSATTTINDTGLSPATNYTYRVRAQDAASNLSAYSSNANAATQYAGPITLTYTYDTLGRISHVAGSDGSSIDYTYDANGNVTTISRQ